MKFIIATFFIAILATSSSVKTLTINLMFLMMIVKKLKWNTKI